VEGAAVSLPGASGRGGRARKGRLLLNQLLGSRGFGLSSHLIDMRKKTKAASTASNDKYEMLIDERRQHILELVQKQGRVLVTDLSSELKISQITIRKDLDWLQSHGLVQRSHGGALRIASSALADPTLQEKQKHHHLEKQKIAAAAVKMVEEGQCVILDSGTPTTAIAHGLKRFSRLTVITNAVNIAADLAGTDFEVILVGGTLRKNSFSLVGPLAEDNLEEMHADILFLGVDGFDLEVGITTPNFLESRVNRAMVKAARKVVVVCDSSKFNHRSLSRIMPPSAIHYLITDRNLPSAAVDALRTQNIDVTLV
jgi:DeoR family transcriptional regulator, aga operon transcriptional repressor